jgi:hypothetical protein
MAWSDAKKKIAEEEARRLQKNMRSYEAIAKRTGVLDVIAHKRGCSIHEDDVDHPAFNAHLATLGISPTKAEARRTFAR